MPTALTRRGFTQLLGFGVASAALRPALPLRRRSRSSPRPAPRPASCG